MRIVNVMKNLKVVRDSFSKISFLSDLPKFSLFIIANTPSLRIQNLRHHSFGAKGKIPVFHTILRFCVFIFQNLVYFPLCPTKPVQICAACMMGDTLMNSIVSFDIVPT